jgi:hypothetical protein
MYQSEANDDQKHYQKGVVLVAVVVAEVYSLPGITSPASTVAVIIVLSASCSLSSENPDGLSKADAAAVASAFF